MLPIPLSTQMQRRLLIGIRAGRIDLSEFAELVPPAADERERLQVDLSILSASELALFNALVVDDWPPVYEPGSGLVILTRETKLAILKACITGGLSLLEIPQLAEAATRLEIDISALSEEARKVLLKLAENMP